MPSNALSLEKSPYLLQHAHNPVDWFPWSDAAFEKARKEDKPIFLSIGYSTCHWCHVMERESFEDETIAKFLNEHFVSIKVDREERPDIDSVYIQFVEAMTGSAGWPLSVWMTCDQKPFFGGTYFPPGDSIHRAGFLSLLKSIAHTWEADREQVKNSADEVTQALKQGIETRQSLMAPEAETLPKSLDVSAKALAQLQSNYDRDYGGFGTEPKFPQPVLLDFLFQYYARVPKTQGGQAALEMALYTLYSMAQGGMYDQLGGGFHRYSTDQRWHVPHFEKMLYDQALLSNVFLSAFQITHEPIYQTITQEILDYVLRDMTYPDGGFYSAEDADSDVLKDGKLQKIEGAYYVWSEKEIDTILGSQFPQTQVRLFKEIFGIKPNGNVPSHQDPHGDLKDQNILGVTRSIDPTAAKSIQECKAALLKARSQRVRPHRDDKILTSWNGLMISALSKAAQVLNHAPYFKAAVRAAEFIKTKLFDSNSNKLIRNYCKGEASKVEGFAQDYAYLIAGLLDLYEATADTRWLEWARTLQTTQDQLFWDKDSGGYFNTDPAHRILLQIKNSFDSAEPSPNSISALNRLRLEQLLNVPQYGIQAAKIIATFAGQLDQFPSVLSQLLVANQNREHGLKQIIISTLGLPKNEEVEAKASALFKTIYSHYIPNKVVIPLGTPQAQDFFSTVHPFYKELKLIDNSPTAYVCDHFACQLPVNTAAALEKIF